MRQESLLQTARKEKNDPAQSHELEGTLERIVFHNPENGYIVFRLKIEGKDDVCTVGSWHLPTPERI